MVTTAPPAGATLRPRRGEETTAGVRVACLIVALDGQRPLDLPSRHWLAKAGEVVLGRSDKGRSVRRAAGPDARRLTLRLPDRMVSARHAILHAGAEYWAIDDLESTNGTFVNGDRIAHAPLANGDVIALGRTCLVYREVTIPESSAAQLPDADDPALESLPVGLRTMSPDLERRFVDLAKLARGRAAIVIMGQTGAGKELVARAVHDLSLRRGEFVPVNCGALPGGLIESELFGHRKGAFSGAEADRDGLVTAASEGTLFLDEIGELPSAAQAALLRALQDGEVRPVGSTRPSRVDMRVVSATNRDLPRLVAQGTFREDLWARLNGYSLELPPLRERKEDLGLLLGVLLSRHATGRATPTFSMGAVRALFAHDWPRNIRELEKTVQSALALAEGREIDVMHLPSEVTDRHPLTPPAGDPDQVLRNRLLALLREHHGNLQRVGNAMGKARQQVQRWCRRLGIDPAEFRQRSGGGTDGA